LKFEHVLHIYWSQYFLFNTKTVVLATTIGGLTKNLFGLSSSFQNYLLARFEMIKLIFNSNKSLLFYNLDILKLINITLSKMTSINYPISELQMLTILRLYLIKTFQGKSHMLGKPVRGQRTWSNGWTSYNSNKLLRTFVNKYFSLLAKNQKEEKINFKKVKKKKKKKTSSSVKKTKQNIAVWF